MFRSMCKSKIHRATVTEANLNYIGSITIDRRLMDLSSIVPYEQVDIANINNGSRFSTYVIEGEANSGVICLNGAASRLVQPGDLVIIMSYGYYQDADLPNFSPKVLFVDANNQPVEFPEMITANE